MGRSGTVFPDLTGSWADLRQSLKGARANLQLGVVGSFAVRNEGSCPSRPVTMRPYLSTSPRLDAARTLSVEGTNDNNVAGKRIP